MRRATAVLVAVLPLLAACDDMIHQPKENAYRNESTGPGKVPNGVVYYAERPEAPPPLTLALIQHGQERFRQWCVPPYDRWAIASYIRALQRSTAGHRSDLSAEEQEALR